MTDSIQLRPTDRKRRLGDYRGSPSPVAGFFFDEGRPGNQAGSF